LYLLPTTHPYLPPEVRPIRYRYKIKKEEDREEEILFLFFSGEKLKGSRKLLHAVCGRSSHHRR
jgi:hypothetical protein